MNNFPRRLSILKGGIGRIANAITWLLNAEFTDTQAAPIPRTAEPGPGALTVVDTGSKASIASGDLTFTGSAANGDPRVFGPSYARQAGRAFLYSIQWSAANAAALGWDEGSAGEPNLLGSRLANGQIYDAGAVPSYSPTLGINTVYSVVQGLRTAGGFLIVKGGAQLPNWTMLWVYIGDTTTPLYPILSNRDTQTNKHAYYRIRDLPAPFNSDFGLATLHQVNPVKDVEYEGEADAIIDFTFTIPNPWTDSFALRYRYVDSQNFWQLGAIAGTAGIRLTSVVSGVVTDRIDVAGALAAGQTYTARVISQGSKHNLYSLNGTTWTKRGSEVDVVTAMDAEKTMRIVENTQVITYVALDAWPRTLSAALAAELDRVEDVTWLLRDDFTTDAAAGQIVRRPAVPGPGTLTYVDSASKLSISSGKLSKATGAVTTIWADPLVVGDAVSRSLGMAVFAQVNNTVDMLLGWRKLTSGGSANVIHACYLSGVALNYWNGVTIGLRSITASIDYVAVLILYASGAILLMKGGTEFSSWTIAFVDTRYTDTPVYPSLNYGASGVNTHDYLRVRALPAPFNTDYGLATLTTTTFTQSLGPELLTNGDFSAWTADNPDGWTVTENGGGEITQRGTGQSHASTPAGTGRCNVFVDNGSGQALIAQGPLVVGKLYESILIVDTTTTGNCTFYAGGVYLPPVTGSKVLLVRAADANIQVYRNSIAPYTDITLTSVSAKRINRNTAANATPDGIFDFEFTVPASPVLGQQIHLLYRIEAVEDEFQDCWDAYLERAASDWTFKLDSISAGTRTNRINVAGITGSPDTIRVICEGSLHDCYTKTGTTWTKRGSQVNVSHLNTAVLVNTVYSSAATPVRLTAWPRTLSAAQAAELERV